MQPNSVRLTGSCIGRAWTTSPFCWCYAQLLLWTYLKTYQKRTVTAWQVHSWWLRRNDLERTKEWDEQPNTSPPFWMGETKLKFTYNLSQLPLYHSSSLGSSATHQFFHLMMSTALTVLSYPHLFSQYPADDQFQQVRLCFSRGQSNPDSLKTSMKQHRSEGQL